MDNNQFNQTITQGGPVSKKKLFEYIGVGCAFVGALIGFIFSIVTCARGPIASVKKATTKKPLVMSLAWIGVLVAVIIMVAGIVLIIVSKEKNAKLSKLATVALIVAVAAVVYVSMVHITICSYNCSYNNYISDKLSRAYGSFFG